MSDWIIELLKNVNFLGTAVGGIIGAIFATIITITVDRRIKIKDAINELYIKREKDKKKVKLINNSNYTLKNLIIVPKRMINKNHFQDCERIEKILANSYIDIDSFLDASSYTIRKSYLPKILKNKAFLCLLDNIIIFLRYKINDLVDSIELLKIHFKTIIKLSSLFKRMKNRNNYKKYTYLIIRKTKESISIQLDSYNFEDHDCLIVFSETLVQRKLLKKMNNYNYYSDVLIQLILFIFNKTPVEKKYNIKNNESFTEEFLVVDLINIKKIKVSIILILRVYFSIIWSKIPMEFYNMQYYIDFFKKQEYLTSHKLEEIIPTYSMFYNKKINSINLLYSFNKQNDFNKIPIFNRKMNKTKTYLQKGESFFYYGSINFLKMFSLLNCSRVSIFHEEEQIDISTFVGLKNQFKTFFLINTKTFEFLHILNDCATIGYLDENDWNVLENMITQIHSKKFKKKFKKYMNHSQTQ